MKKLTKSLQGAGVLKTSGIIRAFLENDRKKFVPAELAGEAYLDMPLPTAHAQTISQPYTVALMLELLQPGSGQKILDIGFGSGWTTAILANIVGQRGRVYGIEVVPEVFEFGKNNLSKMGYNNIALYQKSGWEGLPEAAPFDRILVSAAAAEAPRALLDQLKLNGRMVIPVGESYSCTVKLIQKSGKDKYEEVSHPGFAFVPLVK